MLVDEFRRKNALLATERVGRVEEKLERRRANKKKIAAARKRMKNLKVKVFKLKTFVCSQRVQKLRLH